jgi:ubiquinone/menaquinone biosynthesis C-methylase UbiE
VNKFDIKQQEWDLQALESDDPKKQVCRPFTDNQWDLLVEDVEAKLLIDGELDSILDVGCGNGLLLSRLGKYFGSCHGIDYAEAMIDQADLQMPEGNFSVGHADSIVHADNTFSRVLCFSIFHYFPNHTYAESVISELIRVCRPGGIILIGDLLDKKFEKQIKADSDLDFETKLPLIHQYSEWTFYNLDELAKSATQHTRSVEILTQPLDFKMSGYRKDMRICL